MGVAAGSYDLPCPQSEVLVPPPIVAWTHLLCIVIGSLYLSKTIIFRSALRTFLCRSNSHGQPLGGMIPSTGLG